MSTKDEILGVQAPPGADKQPTAAPSAGAAKPATGNNPAPEPIKKVEAAASVKSGASTSTKPPQRLMTYEQMFQRINPWKAPDPKEIEKEKRREKAASIISLVSDGVSAISNLIATTQYAPNMYDGSKTLSKANQIRYDKMMDKREDEKNAYMKGLFGAVGKDQEAGRQERNYKLALEKEKARAAEKAAERAEKEEQRKYDRDKDAKDREYRKQKDDADRAARKAMNDANIAARKAISGDRADATSAKGVRGKSLGFSDGAGNQVSIYENVWKGSMQQVYDVLCEDMKKMHEEGNGPRVPRHKSAAAKEDFVKQNWHKSERASLIMLALSNIDPATMRSEIVGDENEDAETESQSGLGWGENDNNTDW